MLRQLLAISLFIFSATLPALDLELTQGINSALPIGVNSFGNNEAAEQITQIINNDLRLSGQFKLVSVYNDSTNLNPSLNAWRQAGADTVLMGQVRPLGNNRYEVRCDLLDAAAQGSILLTQSFQISSQQARSLAHHISDMVYEKLTGERGVFSTRIAYILVQRNQGRSRYSLEVADADGYNPRSLVVSSESIMSPSWSPDGKKIAYVSFEKKKAQIFIVNAVDGRRQLVTNFNGINGAPAWSPDGKQLAVVLSKGGSPKIYTVELSNGHLQQLTFGDAIDTEPRFSPDGHSVIFTSGRGGAPQIYRIALADGTISRLTYSGNYNARASFTPDQKRIVLMHRNENKHFNIAVQDLTNGQLSPITNASADESPSVAPNGRLVVYATQHRGQGILGIVSTDGRIQLRLPTREGDVQEPAWSPYLG